MIKMHMWVFTDPDWVLWIKGWTIEYCFMKIIYSWKSRGRSWIRYKAVCFWCVTFYRMIEDIVCGWQRTDRVRQSRRLRYDRHTSALLLQSPIKEQAEQREQQQNILTTLPQPHSVLSHVLGGAHAASMTEISCNSLCLPRVRHHRSPLSLPANTVIAHGRRDRAAFLKGKALNRSLWRTCLHLHVHEQKRDFHFICFLMLPYLAWREGGDPCSRSWPVSDTAGGGWWLGPVPSTGPVPFTSPAKLQTQHWLYDYGITAAKAELSRVWQ